LDFSGLKIWEFGGVFSLDFLVYRKFFHQLNEFGALAAGSTPTGGNESSVPLGFSLSA